MSIFRSNSQRFDVVILGSGMAGIPAVQKCLDLGAKTAIVIGNLLGGTCLNVGCIPTKAIWQANHMKTEIERSKKFGYTIEERLAKKRSYNNSNQKYKQQQNFVDFKSIMEYQAKIVNGLMGLKTNLDGEYAAINMVKGNTKKRQNVKPDYVFSSVEDMGDNLSVML